MKNMTITLPEEAQQYEGMCLALSPDLKRVLGHGPTPIDAARMAEESGEMDYVFYHMPKSAPGVVII